jgi:hypothetical protein
MKQMNSYKLILAAGLSLAFTLPPAVAQEAVEPVEQIRPAGPGDWETPIEQVSTGTRDVATPLGTATLVDAPVQQLSSANERDSAPTQLTDAERDAKAPQQLYRGGPTAQPPQALSRRSEGRTGAVDRVEGEDACDPADEAEKAQVCDRVIETRAAEFVRPDPTTLSPEQRLLIQQRLREDPTSGANAARRLARDGDADSLQGLGVASIVLNRPPAPSEEKPTDPAKDAAAEAAALVTAIINQTGSSGTPPQ